MANIKSAKKRAVTAVQRRSHNVAQRSRMRTYLKKVMAAIEEGDQKQAQEAYRTAVSIMDNYADKGLIHKNTAARKKSRLNARIKAMTA